MILTTRPNLEIKQEEDNKWTIKTISLLRTVELTFTLGEEFIESMPSGVTLKVLLFISSLKKKLKNKFSFCFVLI